MLVTDLQLVRKYGFNSKNSVKFLGRWEDLGFFPLFSFFPRKSIITGKNLFYDVKAFNFKCEGLKNYVALKYV